MIKNKKGIFFTLVVIVIITLFLLSYTFVSVVNERQRIQKRVETMSNFLAAIEDDFERKLFISGFRGIFAFEKYLINNTHSQIDDVEDRFIELLMNGTLFGIDEEVMIGATWGDIISSVNSNANKINVIVNLSAYPTIIVDQEDPWRVRFTVITKLEMFDQSGLASWNKTETIIAYVPIEGFEDPFWIFGTGAGKPSIIKRSENNASDIVPGNMVSHATSQEFVNNSEAPSFIDRLERDFTASGEYGIESLVNWANVPSNLHIEKTGKSIADHEFWQSNAPDGNDVVGVSPTWIRLTSSHCGPIYDVTC